MTNDDESRKTNIERIADDALLKLTSRLLMVVFGVLTPFLMNHAYSVIAEQGKALQKQGELLIQLGARVENIDNNSGLRFNLVTDRSNAQDARIQRIEERLYRQASP